MDLIYKALLFVKYSLQSIILEFVYVVLMNLFVDKMVAASLKLLRNCWLLFVYAVLMTLFVNRMVAASLKLLNEMESASTSLKLFVDVNVMTNELIYLALLKV